VIRVSTQPAGIGIKSNNKGGRGEVKKFGSIIYRHFIRNSITHKIYDYPYKDAI
jgi:hypothetical protein